MRALFGPYLLALVVLATSVAQSTTAAEPLRFSVLMHVLKDAAEDSELRAAFDIAQAGEPAFIVVNGMRSPREACTDRLYRHRAALRQDRPRLSGMTVWAM